MLWAALFPATPTPHPQIHVEALTHSIQMTTAPHGRCDHRVTSIVAGKAGRHQGAPSVWGQRKFGEEAIIELAPEGWGRMYQTGKKIIHPQNVACSAWSGLWRDGGCWSILHPWRKKVLCAFWVVIDEVKFSPLWEGFHSLKFWLS